MKVLIDYCLIRACELALQGKRTEAIRMALEAERLQVRLDRIKQESK